MDNLLSSYRKVTFFQLVVLLSCHEVHVVKYMLCVVCNVCSLSCKLDTKCSNDQARSSRIKGVFFHSQLMKNIS